MEWLTYYGKLFSIIFLIQLILYYLIPVGITYWILNIWKKDFFSKIRIQKKYPSSRAVRREIKWSVVSLLIFSIITTILYILILKDYTKVYFEIRQYSLLYFIASPFLILFLHDAYFYWTHRLMHLRAVFKYVHRLHHRSITPTPWAIFSFSPFEAVIQIAFYPLLIFIIPVHYIPLIIAITYNVITNIGGHSGFEITDKYASHHWLLKYNNTVTHHDFHHTNFNSNYSLYFNIWDRIMKTYHKSH